MDISLHTLNYDFSEKPLLVGGKAMEYYGIRKSGMDIDLIAPESDVIHLIKLYPDKVKNLWGDLGVCPFQFEIWNTIRYLSYADLKEKAIEEADFLIISLEKLLLMKAMAIDIEKYLIDTKLIATAIGKSQTKQYDAIKSHNETLLNGIEGITYLQQTGPNTSP